MVGERFIRSQSSLFSTLLPSNVINPPQPWPGDPVMKLLPVLLGAVTLSLLPNAQVFGGGVSSSAGGASDVPEYKALSLADIREQFVAGIELIKSESVYLFEQDVDRPPP